MMKEEKKEELDLIEKPVWITLLSFWTPGKSKFQIKTPFPVEAEPDLDSV